jgi:hypothetical protein
MTPSAPSGTTGKAPSASPYHSTTIACSIAVSKLFFLQGFGKAIPLVAGTVLPALVQIVVSNFRYYYTIYMGSFMNTSIVDVVRPNIPICRCWWIKAQADLSGLRDGFCNRHDVAMDGNPRAASVSDDCLSNNVDAPSWICDCVRPEANEPSGCRKRLT